MTIAYVLAVFLGAFGAHQFYLRHPGIAVTQLVLTVLGWLTAWLIIGWFLIVPVWCWVVVDLFLIPGWVRRANGLQV
jgi:TM2 domain-containing membrane protein YozV